MKYVSDSKLTCCSFFSLFGIISVLLFSVGSSQRKHHTDIKNLIVDETMQLQAMPFWARLFKTNDVVG